ncbi:bifunctional DNA primase/polymerase [Streptomyces sp. NPDC048845]|uniref:bifunctional DNA primase/polymerase n=1 Tax=Streptomyces sp. NPDC048845 TaxID=3155390 RepID=UPI003428C51E
MREIPGMRRRLLPRRRRSGKPVLPDTALTCAAEWQWPVVPGVGQRPGSGRRGGCGCPHPDCAAPAAHPFDPGLLAATTDARMVRWWWTNRPTAPIILATGGRAPCAVSLPAVAAASAVAELERTGVRLGPVVATPDRWSLLVAPYALPELGELLYSQDWVPGSLRFHGEGGYLALPPSRTGAGQVRWERAPGTDGGAPWLPEVQTVVEALVEASAGSPGGGSRLPY